MGKKTLNKQSPTCQGRWCQTHHFSMRPIFISLSNPHQDSVRLCPKLNRDKKIYQKVTPKLNLDRKYYTPSFILQEDQRLYIDHDRSNQRNFKNSVLSEQEQISQIVTILLIILQNYAFLFVDIMQMIPKVNSSSPFCRVCRQHYEDYLQHVNSPQHCQNVGRHPYSAFIVELVENLKTNGCKQTIIQNSNSGANFIKNNQSFMECQISSQLQDKESCFRLKQHLNEKTIQ